MTTQYRLVLLALVTVKIVLSIHVLRCEEPLRFNRYLEPNIRSLWWSFFFSVFAFRDDFDQRFLLMARGISYLRQFMVPPYGSVCTISLLDPLFWCEKQTYCNSKSVKSKEEFDDLYTWFIYLVSFSL